MLTNVDSTAAFTNFPTIGWYTVEVSAAGYHTQRQDCDVSDNLTFAQVDVTMQPDSDEGSATFLSSPCGKHRFSSCASMPAAPAL
jgi:hypothetical protein